MAKYLDGIQQQDDSINDFVTVASGTVSVGTNQYPQTTVIPRPTKLYRNYILLINNKSGQTMNNAHVFGRNLANNNPLPNTNNTNTNIFLKASIGNSTPNNSQGALDLTSEEPNPFTAGTCLFQFNLAAAPTSGTIDWALIGY
jgi:hypothetical protein